MGAAAALMVIALCGGLAVAARLTLPGGAQEASDSAQEAAPGAAGVPDGASTMADDGQLTILESGTDYRTDTLADLAGRPLPTPSAPAPAMAPGDTTEVMPSPAQPPRTERATIEVKDDLSEFAATPRLEQCLAAVTAIHPGDVVLADFARYEGRPAVVLLIRNGGRSTVVAVGPACGDGGPDELAAVEVA
jgi:hypothetical protein